MKTNQSLREILVPNWLEPPKYVTISGSNDKIFQIPYDTFIKAISELLVECSDVESISKNETFLEGYATAKDEIKANLLEALQ